MSGGEENGSIRHHTLVMFESEMNSEARGCLLAVERAAKISAAKGAKSE
jgi:hypothetical protein